MPTEILMPALSPTMEEGTLAKWHVKEGDTVSSGDIMAEIETDKATMEFEAVDEGVMGKISALSGVVHPPLPRRLHLNRRRAQHQRLRSQRRPPQPLQRTASVSLRRLWRAGLLRTRALI